MDKESLGVGILKRTAYVKYENGISCFDLATITGYMIKPFIYYLNILNEVVYKIYITKIKLKSGLWKKYRMGFMLQSGLLRDILIKPCASGWTIFDH